MEVKKKIAEGVMDRKESGGTTQGIAYYCFLVAMLLPLTYLKPLTAVGTNLEPGGVQKTRHILSPVIVELTSCFHSELRRALKVFFNFIFAKDLHVSNLEL